MAKTMKMLLVTDESGRIVGAGHPTGRSPQQGMHVGITPLPGQRVHEVDVPEEIARLKSGHDLHLALSSLVVSGSGKVDFKKMKIKRPGQSKQR